MESLGNLVVAFVESRTRPIHTIPPYADYMQLGPIHDSGGQERICFYGGDRLSIYMLHKGLSDDTTD